MADRVNSYAHVTYEDFSGIATGQFANPYDALIESCNHDPVSRLLDPSYSTRIDDSAEANPRAIRHPSYRPQCATEGQDSLVRLHRNQHRPCAVEAGRPINRTRIQRPKILSRILGSPTSKRQGLDHRNPKESIGRRT